MRVELMSELIPLLKIKETRDLSLFLSILSTMWEYKKTAICKSESESLLDTKFVDALIDLHVH